MTRKDLVNLIMDNHPDLDSKYVQRSVSLFFYLIGAYLTAKQRVELRGLGTFSVRRRNAYISRNPQTGEPVTIEEKFVPFFKPSLAMKNYLKNSYKPSLPKKKGFFQSILGG